MLNFKKMKMIEPEPQNSQPLMSDSMSPSPIMPMPPQNQDEAGSTASFDDGAHIDTLIAVAEEEAPASLPVNRLSKEDFHRVFCTGFTVSSHVTGLKSLAVDEHDGKARAASEALYETILDIPALHFMLSPGGKWGGRIMAIAAFAIPMARGVQDELVARRTVEVPRVVAAKTFPDVKMGA